MFMGRPVIGQNNGGPTESIGPDCGFLLRPEPKLWATKMKEVVEDKVKSDSMGLKGRRNVVEKFSFEAFQNSITGIVKGMLGRSDKKGQ